MLDSGTWAYPTIDGRPWLEKPPLPWWLVAAAGRIAGGVDESVARLPSAIAATLLVLGVAVLAARHYGPGIGLLAGAVQATTAWTVAARPAGRGRRPAGLPDHLGHRRLRPDGRRPRPTMRAGGDGVAAGGRSSSCWGPRRWSRGSASAPR